MMDESDTEDASTKNGRTECGMTWWYLKELPHQYQLDVPSKMKNQIKDCYIDLPYPIFNPLEINKYPTTRDILNSNVDDSRLKYYKKLYSKEDKKALKEALKNDVAVVPQYVYDITTGALNDHPDPHWYYTGGVLTTFSILDDVYIARAGLNQPLRVTTLNSSSDNSDIEINELGPMYHIKSTPFKEGVLLAVRQKRDMPFLYFEVADDGLSEYKFWNATSGSSLFRDMAFNKFGKTQISIINEAHKFSVIDLQMLKKELEHKFLFVNSSISNDCLAQVTYVDTNTLCYMNRLSVNLIDLRSLATKELKLKCTYFQCDDFCTVNNSTLNSNQLLTSSFHSCMIFDVRSEGCINKIKHLLTSPPYLADSIKDNDDNELICLLGQNLIDKVILQNSSGEFSLPQYVPNTKDTLSATSLTYKIYPHDNFNDRLTSQFLGIKLYRDIYNDKVYLYSSNSVGDVFKQEISHTELDSSVNLNRLYEWINLLPYKPKAVEATSIRNMGKLMSAVKTNSPRLEKLSKMMEENPSKKLFEKHCNDLQRCLEGNVGEAMNSIWGDEDVLEEDIDLPPSVSPKHKVSEWLSYVP